MDNKLYLHHQARVIMDWYERHMIYDMMYYICLTFCLSMGLVCFGAYVLIRMHTGLILFWPKTNLNKIFLNDIALSSSFSILDLIRFLIGINAFFPEFIYV